MTIDANAALNQFWTHFDTFAAKIQQAAPIVYQKVVLTVWYESIGQLFIGFILLGVSFALFLKGRAVWNSIQKLIDAEKVTYKDDHYKSGKTDYIDYPQTIMAVILLCLSVLAMAASVCSYLTDPWAWIGAFNPEAATIHQMLDKLHIL